MATTYTEIASVTVGSGGSSSITFSSIPNTYTDLAIKILSRSNRSDTSDWMQIKPNGSTSSWTSKIITGNGSSAGSTTQAGLAGFAMNGNTATTNTFGSADIYIPNYAGSTYKSFSVDAVGEGNGTTAYATLYTALWADTTAISSIVLAPSYSSGFVQYTTAYLYGISNS